MGLNELTEADKVSPLAAEYRPPFIVPKRLLLACICIEKILIAKSSNHQKSFPEEICGSIINYIVQRTFEIVTSVFLLLFLLLMSYIQNFFQINQQNNKLGSTLQKI